MWFCGISKHVESNIHETVKFSHLYFCANNTLFCSNYTATHDKTCYYYSAAIYCIYIILISYTAFNWTCVMENGDLDITFHMESFFSGLFDLLLRSYGNFSLIVLNFFIMKHVGFLQYIAKLKGHIFQLWERIKKKLGGPRK